MKEKVLIIGWDGAPFKLIKDYVKKGELPVLKEIVENGFLGPLETCSLTISSCAWSTIVTGKNAGKHGIFDFYSNEFSDDSYFRKAINANSRKELELWKILSKHGIKVCIINIPLTYPAVKVNGLMVAGMLSPSVTSKYFTYPPDLLRSYEGLKDYVIEFEGDKYMSRDQYVEDVNNMIESRTRLILYLMEKNKDLDVLFAVFTAPDRFSHHFWHYLDESHPYRKNESEQELNEYRNGILAIYKKLDEKLGIIIKKFQSEINKDFTIVLVSDHGFSSLKKILHLNKYLYLKGYLKFKEEGEWRDPQKDVLNRRVSYIYGKIDWLKTEAYAIGKRGAIYLNLEGREPKGIVKREDYEVLIKKLKEDLKIIKDQETGENIIRWIKSRDELFFGEYIKNAPDILISPRNGYVPFGYAFELDKPDYISINDRRDLPFVTGIESGDGIICFKGKNIKPDVILGNAQLMDFTPTLLSLLGLPIPTDMDGKVLTQIFA